LAKLVFGPNQYLEASALLCEQTPYLAMPRLEASSITNRSGRWSRTPSGSLVASWSSASLSFLFSGSRLSFSVGQETERKDKSNGGTPMIAVITGVEEESAVRSVSDWRTFDPAPGSEIDIIQEETEHQKTFIRIILIDWASKIELEAFIVDEARFTAHLFLSFYLFDVKSTGSQDRASAYHQRKGACGVTSHWRLYLFGHGYPFRARRRTGPVWRSQRLSFRRSTSPPRGEWIHQSLCWPCRVPRFKFSPTNRGGEVERLSFRDDWCILLGEQNFIIDIILLCL